MITPKVITAPTKEPISLTEAKSHIRVEDDFTADDTLIALYIAAARRHFERQTSRTIHQTTYEMSFPGFPSGGCPLLLPRATPLIEVDSVIYKDSDGNEEAWSSSLYVLDNYNEPGFILPAYGESYPSFTPYPVNPVIVRYAGGTATASPETECSESIKIAIMVLVGALYENRETEVVEQGITRVALACGFDRFIQEHIVEYAF